jgi:CubicO group peptidase (beta-lactamase class C family)
MRYLPEKFKAPNTGKFGVGIHTHGGYAMKYFGKGVSAITLLTVVWLCAPAVSAQYYPPADRAGGWRTLKNPAEIRLKTGLDVKQLDAAFQYIQGSSQNGGLLVVRHGWLVYERYFGRANREATPDTTSCGKSFTSLALGMLMHERPDLFPDGLSQKVYTPRYLPAAAFPVNDPRKREIRLGQLLAMTAGLAGNSPGYVYGKPVPIIPEGLDGWEAMVDANAFSERLWCKPGGGYSYATTGPQIVSALIRHVTGMELQQYLEIHLARPLGWGRWGFGLRDHPEIKHTPGGGGICLRATDMLRFEYLLLHQGRWGSQQLAPAAYVRKATTPSPFNPHYGYSLDFELNSDSAAPGAPRDAYWKHGAGGFALYAVPSLDLIVWKMGGPDSQYEEKDTGLPEVKPYGERPGWKRSVDEDASVLRTLEMVVAAVHQGVGTT